MARYTGPVCRLCRREGMKLYLKGARCDGPKCPIVKRQPAKNFPPMPRATPANWKGALAALRTAQNDLHRAVLALPESRLKKIVPGKRYSLYFMLHGLVQHDLYHAGQIALLKKAGRR